MKFKYIVTVLLGIFLMLPALSAATLERNDRRETRADIIIIDSMKIFGDLEKSAVSFPHDQHTDALEKQGKNCTTCHQKKDDLLVLKFQRTKEIDQETSLDIYHTNCINCHEEKAAEGLKTGPLECGECHQRAPEVVAARELIDFDASMHHRHIKAANDTCDSCHHSVDADNNKIPYVKGNEESCRTCHKEETRNKAIPYQSASHQQCIGCHQKEIEKAKIESKVVAANKCAGCHDETQLKQITKLESIPRLDRKQPDTTFVKSLDDLTKQMMDPVIFKHEIHEKNISNCSTCHHETLKSCESCHTFSGSKEGDWVTLAQAMHKAESDRSCIGCHNKEQQDKTCVGCHALTARNTHGAEGKSCQSCHNVPLAKLKGDQASGKELLAQHYLLPRAQETRIDYKAFPANIMIDAISDKYQASKFPHEHIVETLMFRIRESGLATNFHQEKDLVCQSCHHNSPDVVNPPPRCISCHAPAGDAQKGHIPRAKAAYHQQCFECHESMEIKSPVSTDCVACHKEK